MKSRLLGNFAVKKYSELCYHGYPVIGDKVCQWNSEDVTDLYAVEIDTTQDI